MPLTMLEVRGVVVLVVVVVVRAEMLVKVVVKVVVKRWRGGWWQCRRVSQLGLLQQCMWS